MEKSSSSIGLGGVVFVVFLILKLIGKITWSWWWVTFPLWIGFAVWIVVVLIIILVYHLRKK